MITGSNLLAADPTNDHVINAADGLCVARRCVQSITSFPAGDWIFESPTVDIVNSSVTQNIYGLCIGDVNGSYTPINTIPEY